MSTPYCGGQYPLLQVYVPLLRSLVPLPTAVLQRPSCVLQSPRCGLLHSRQRTGFSFGASLRAPYRRRPTPCISPQQAVPQPRVGEYSRALPSTPEHSRALPSTPEHSRALPSTPLYQEDCRAAGACRRVRSLRSTRRSSIGGGESSNAQHATHATHATGGRRHAACNAQHARNFQYIAYFMQHATCNTKHAAYKQVGEGGHAVQHPEHTRAMHTASAALLCAACGARLATHQHGVHCVRHAPRCAPLRRRVVRAHREAHLLAVASRAHAKRMQRCAPPARPPASRRRARHRLGGYR
jgi:hypothetical protein